MARRSWSPPLSPDTSTTNVARHISDASPLYAFLSFLVVLVAPYYYPPCIRAYGSAASIPIISPRTIERPSAPLRYHPPRSVPRTRGPHSAKWLTRNTITSVRSRRHQYPHMKKPHLPGMLQRASVQMKSATTQSGRACWVRIPMYNPTQDGGMDTTRRLQYSRWKMRICSAVRCGKARTRTCGRQWKRWRYWTQKQRKKGAQGGIGRVRASRNASTASRIPSRASTSRGYHGRRGLRSGGRISDS